MNKEFLITDLGKLNYFLGLEVSYHDTGLFLSQSKYAHDILSRAHMLDAKPVSTPLSTTDYFTSQGTPFSDVTLYRSLVGALQYLTITRPDLSYAVNQVSQFLHAPMVDHFNAVKRILRYVKGTLSYGLSFSHASSPSILGYLMLSGHVVSRHDDLLMVTLSFLGEIWFPGVLRNNPPCLALVVSRNIELLPTLLRQRLFGLLTYFVNYMFCLLDVQQLCVTIAVLFFLVKILLLTNMPSI